MRADSAVLDVACLSTFMMRWLIPRLHQFHALHPDIDLRLRALDQSPDSRGEQADLVVTVDEGPRTRPGERLDGLLFKEWLGPVATPALLERLGPLAKGDLPAELMLETRSRLNAWQMWQAAVDCRSLAPAGPVFEHYYFTLEAVSAGLGFCIAPWHLVIAEVQSGRLSAPFGFVESGYAYVAKQRQHGSARIAQFHTWLASEAGRMPLPG
jgi:DNA-binding transcriptional LysR family regulator